MAKETNVDCMKYRKHSHLAGVDVDTIVSEKGFCILTIKEAYYSDLVIMNGKKSAGYYIEFIEDIKPMCVNTGNRKTISDIVKITKGLTSAKSRICSNWVGTTIELYFEPDRSFGGVKTGGIAVKSISPISNASDVNACVILNTSTSIEELKLNWSKLNQTEQSLPTVVALKETLKNRLK